MQSFGGSVKAKHLAWQPLPLSPCLAPFPCAPNLPPLHLRTPTPHTHTLRLWRQAFAWSKQAVPLEGSGPGPTAFLLLSASRELRLGRVGDRKSVV